MGCSPFAASGNSGGPPGLGSRLRPRFSNIHQELDMAYVVAIISPGEMGSAVAARLSQRGIKVTTSLPRRSPDSAAGGQRAPMFPGEADDALVGGAGFFLSIF